jgi:hypothetical protein
MSEGPTNTAVNRVRNGRIVPSQRVRMCRAGGRHQVGWCLALCQPTNGRGLCGRQAPHAVHGRTYFAMKESEERGRQPLEQQSTAESTP